MKNDTFRINSNLEGAILMGLDLTYLYLCMNSAPNSSRLLCKLHKRLGMTRTFIVHETTLRLNECVFNNALNEDNGGIGMDVKGVSNVMARSSIDLRLRNERRLSTTPSLTSFTRRRSVSFQSFCSCLHCVHH